MKRLIQRLKRGRSNYVVGPQPRLVVIREEDFHQVAAVLARLQARLGHIEDPTLAGEIRQSLIEHHREVPPLEVYFHGGDAR